MEQSFELHRAPLDGTASTSQPITATRVEGIAAAAMLLAYTGLRLMLLRMLTFNSDEAQHAHVAWAWSKGLIPYRDVFDNHMPLFHLLAAPLFHLFGETPDILLWLRIAMVPVSVLALAMAYLIARALWSHQVALWSVALTAVCPLYLRVAGEFRTDVLWGAAWLAAMAVAVCGRWSPRRAWLLGLLVGVAFAVSLKSMLLATSLATAWVLVYAGLPAEFRPSLRSMALDTGRLLLGASVVPALMVALVAAKGGGAAMRYDVLIHNALPGLGDASSGMTRLPRMLGLLLLLVVAVRPRRATGPAIDARRALVIASAAIYGLLLLGGWPLLSPQDNLPVTPLLMMPLVGWLMSLPLRRYRPALPAALLLAGLAALLARRHALEDRTLEDRDTLATVLSITSPADPVLDDKGSSIFRYRPYYFALESITLERLRRGLIADDIVPRLIATDTHVVWSRRLPAQDHRFVEQNYLPLGKDLHVAGVDLGWLPAGARREINVELPGVYALLPGGDRGTVDGETFDLDRMLAAGRHTIASAQGGHYRMVWAPAARYFASASP